MEIGERLFIGGIQDLQKKTIADKAVTAPADPPHIFSLRSNKRGPRVWGYVSQKRTTGGAGQKRPDRNTAPVDPPHKPTPDFLAALESLGAPGGVLSLP